MNPIFVFLVVIGVVILWFLLAFAFRPLGKIVRKIWMDAVNEINKEDVEEREEKKK